MVVEFAVAVVIVVVVKNFVNDAVVFSV